MERMGRILTNLMTMKNNNRKASNWITITMTMTIMIAIITAWEMTSSTMTPVVIIIIMQTISIPNNKIIIPNVLESRHRRKRASHYPLHKGHHH